MSAIERLRFATARWHLGWIDAHEQAADSAMNEAFQWLSPDEDGVYDDPAVASSEASRLVHVAWDEIARAARHKRRVDALFDKLLIGLVD